MKQEQTDVHSENSQRLKKTAVENPLESNIVNLMHKLETREDFSADRGSCQESW